MNTQTVKISGAAPSFSAPLASDTAALDATLIVKNGSAAAITVTLATVGNLPTGDAYPDKVYTVAAGAEAWIPVLRVYNNGSGGADVAFSSVTSVTAAVVRL